MVLWQVFLFLILGSALRYLLPYVLKGLMLLGEEKPWPKWEWKYLSAFLLALIGFGVMFLTQEGLIAELQAMSWVPLVTFAYGGNQMAREVVKALDHVVKLLGIGDR